MIKTSAPFLLLLALFMTGCIGKMISNQIQDDGNQFPPDFGREPDTLLAVLKERKNYDETLTETMASSYTGPYKLVTRADLGQQYADTATYPYVFDSELGTSADMEHASYQVFVWDRRAQREFRAGASSGLYGLLMRIYLEKLDVKRKANGGE